METAQVSRRDFFVLGGAAVGALASPGESHAEYRVRDSDDLASALAAAESGRFGRLTISLPAQTYVLADTARITQSNVAVIAEPGTKVRLANHVNQPVIAIGSQADPPAGFIENVYLFGLDVDGNKANQDQETALGRPWIRNNGIDVRAVRRLVVDNVVAHDARSGGLVTSYGSSDVYVVNSSFERNFFDGLAYYDSQRIHTRGCTMLANGAAGVSIDNNLRDCIFSDCIADGNLDVGIFARYARELRFNNCVIKNSHSHATFLSHDQNGNGVHDLLFCGCHVLFNGGHGIYVASTADRSDRTSVVGCVFRGNTGSPVKEEGSPISQAANIVQ